MRGKTSLTPIRGRNFPKSNAKAEEENPLFNSEEALVATAAKIYKTWRRSLSSSILHLILASRTLPLVCLCEMLQFLDFSTVLSVAGNGVAIVVIWSGLQALQN
ncbi:hypothetical protein RJT34_00262 [Clitoria ternatea]|uniref:Uncharacterized protein n=1 Tax=Clitoria ternatea TaxID=43366 RepID=A0AAN9KHR6_CLITE